MNNFKELQDFIESNPSNWQDLLKDKPYSMKSINQCPYDKSMWMIVYNLFSSDLSNKIVKQTRGTVVKITDGKCEIVCAPYLKFFNYNDPLADNIDWSSAKIHEKIDGQLIKFSKFNDDGYWFTNGSFTLGVPLDIIDDNVHNFRELLYRALSAEDKSNNITCNYESQEFLDDESRIKYESSKFNYTSDWTDRIPNGWTLMFELTSKYNKIQVQYDISKIWFHGARDNFGNEHTPEEVAKMFGIPYEIPKSYDLKTMEDVKTLLDSFNEDKEGLVVCDKNFNRIKCKSDVYLNMKFSQELSSPKSIWEITIKEEYDDILPLRPDIKPLIDNQIKEIDILKNGLKKVYLSANEKFKELGCDRKLFAAWNTKDNKNQKLNFSSIKAESFEDFYKNIISHITSLKSSSGYKLYNSYLSNL